MLLFAVVGILYKTQLSTTKLRVHFQGAISAGKIAQYLIRIYERHLKTVTLPPPPNIFIQIENNFFGSKIKKE
jgi:hypothetical protein